MINSTINGGHGASTTSAISISTSLQMDHVLLSAVIPYWIVYFPLLDDLTNHLWSISDVWVCLFEGLNSLWTHHQLSYTMRLCRAPSLFFRQRIRSSTRYFTVSMLLFWWCGWASILVALDRPTLCLFTPTMLEGS